MALCPARGDGASLVDNDVERGCLADGRADSQGDTSMMKATVVAPAVERIT
jgi:hypothetical protein